MSMQKKWHVIGIMYNEELNRKDFIDYVVENCDTVDEAVEQARVNGVTNITGAFLHSQLVAK